MLTGRKSRRHIVAWCGSFVYVKRPIKCDSAYIVHKETQTVHNVLITRAISKISISNVHGT